MAPQSNPGSHDTSNHRRRLPQRHPLIIVLAGIVLTVGMTGACANGTNPNRVPNNPNGFAYPAGEVHNYIPGSDPRADVKVSNCFVISRGSPSSVSAKVDITNHTTVKADYNVVVGFAAPNGEIVDHAYFQFYRLLPGGTTSNKAVGPKYNQSTTNCGNPNTKDGLRVDRRESANTTKK